jgi:hypothetical protein
MIPIHPESDKYAAAAGLMADSLARALFATH